MNQETQTNEQEQINTNFNPINLVVTRDGELDKEYYRNQKIEALGHSALNVVKIVGKGIKTGLGNLALNIKDELDLVVTDTLYGTNFRAKRAEARDKQYVSSKAMKYGIKF